MQLVKLYGYIVLAFTISVELAVFDVVPTSASLCTRDDIARVISLVSRVDFGMGYDGVCGECSAGYYRNSTYDRCVGCPRGSFLEAENHTHTQCTLCPTHNITGKQSTTLRWASTNADACFYEPEIRSFSPLIGPLSGGTRVMVQLFHFENRYNVTYANVARMGAREYYEDKSAKIVTIVTERAPVLYQTDLVYITFSFDRRYSSNQQFSYVEDPVVESIDTSKTFISGGLDIWVTGQYLDHVQQPMFFITMVYRGHQFRANHSCTVKADTNATLMSCRTPDFRPLLKENNIPHVTGRARRAAGEPSTFNDIDKQFYAGFEFDGVQEFQNISDALDQGQFLVYLDPEYREFEEENMVRYFNPDDVFLYIQGERLNYACEASDITVKIGVELCNVTLLASNMLTCIPPPTQPEHEENGFGPNRTPRVSVHVGNLAFIIGFLDYSAPPTYPPPVSVKAVSSRLTDRAVFYGVIAGAILVALILLAVTISLIVFARRRRNSHKLRATARAEARLGSNRQKEGVERGGMRGGGRYVSNNRHPGVVRNGVNYTDVIDGSGNVSYVDAAVGRSRQISETITPPLSPDRAYMQPLSPYISSTGDETSTPHVGVLEKLEESLRLAVEECLIASSQLTIGPVIGTGHFGKVFKGTLTRKEDINETVAVKTMLGAVVSVKEVGAFLEEAVIMRDFDHENVLSQIGIAMQGDQPLVILPYMCNGDLKAYIREPTRSLKVKELLDFGLQISRGMIYLSKQKFVHRDLATRNCMLNGSMVVKIADFGLSRDVYKTDYYRVEDRHRPLPVRWMAIESLTSGVFSAKSDVWSFGVTVWELLTRGCLPYPDVDTFNIKQYVCSGRRLDQPDHTPDDVYEILQSCWRENPEDRPDFTELHHSIDHILDTSSPQYAQMVFPAT